MAPINFLIDPQPEQLKPVQQTKCTLVDYSAASKSLRAVTSAVDIIQPKDCLYIQRFAGLAVKCCGLCSFDTSKLLCLRAKLLYLETLKEVVTGVLIQVSVISAILSWCFQLVLVIWTGLSDHAWS